MKPLLFFALLSTAAACASSGQPEVEPVPVYFDDADVPCEYVVAGSVEGEVRATGSFEWRRRASSVLGREGRRLGFDAVLVDTSLETARVARVSERSTGVVPAATVRGEGLRYTEEGCGILG